MGIPSRDEVELFGARVARLLALVLGWGNIRFVRLVVVLYCQGWWDGVGMTR